MFPCSLRYFANVPFFPRTPAWPGDPRYFCFRSKLNYVLLCLDDTSGADIEEMLTDFLNERRRLKLLEVFGGMLSWEFFFIYI